MPPPPPPNLLVRIVKSYIWEIYDKSQSPPSPPPPPTRLFGTLFRVNCKDVILFYRNDPNSTHGLLKDGGRFLIALRELFNSERILATRSLLKENINVWEENLQPDRFLTEDLQKLECDVKEVEAEVLESQLSEESYQVAVYIAGYVAKKLTERSDCNACISMLKASSNDLSHAEYLRNMSRGGLIIPSLQLAQYASSGFSTLDFVDNLISKSEVPARIAAEHILKLFLCKVDFVCSLHFDWGQKYANRIITNIFYNNMQKKSKEYRRKEHLTAFKKRQRTK